MFYEFKILSSKINFNNLQIKFSKNWQSSSMLFQLESVLIFNEFEICKVIILFLDCLNEFKLYYSTNFLLFSLFFPRILLNVWILCINSFQL